MKINEAGKSELNTLKSDKSRYIKDTRLALFKQFLPAKTNGFQNINIVESYNLINTPYSVMFAVKIDNRVRYYESNEGNSQKLSLLKLKENDLATRAYYNIVFQLTDSKDYDTLKNLYKKRNISHPKFCNYYVLSLNREYGIEEFIHFKDFGLLEDELTGQTKN